MEIGFIGLGIMGRPMALNLQAAGHTMHVVQRPGAGGAELQQAGAIVHSNPREVAAAADVIILMLPDTPDVDVVLFGESGVTEGLTAGKTVIDMSSIDPIATKHMAERIAALRCHWADAPVSGGDAGAKAATLTIMVGATEDTFAAIKPLLETMGKTITLVGGPGAGQIAKVANQIIVALNIEAVAEALVFAARAGADPARVRDALMGGFASSRVLEVHGKKMLDRTFDPGFRIRLHQKDLNLALAGARSLGMALPNTASTQQLFSACVAHGYGGSDHSAVISALELLAGCSPD